MERLINGGIIHVVKNAIRAANQFLRRLDLPRFGEFPRALLLFILCDQGVDGFPAALKVVADLRIHAFFQRAGVRQLFQTAADFQSVIHLE